MRCWLTILAALWLSAALAAPAAAEAPEPTRIIAPLADGDEPIVVTTHTIQTADGPLTYEARAGRLPIRDDETGEVRAHVFFVAYVVRERGAERPLTIAWNGGPTIPSIYVHAEFLGPRRITPDGFVDNPLTLLTRSDLVFYDPVETGFSRPAQPRFAPEFMTMQGDVAAAAEFVRAYRARFAAQTQPLILLGESYGVWRAAAVGEALARRGVPVAGLALISGGLPSIHMPMAFWNAMNVPTRTLTALHYGRLAPDLMRDPAATLAAVRAWTASTYLPALEGRTRLTDAGREAMARQLAAYTGVRPDQIDRASLVMSTEAFLDGFFPGDPARRLSDVDTRLFGDERQPPQRHLAISRYLRQELGYATDLGYAGELGAATDLGYRALEAGYNAAGGPPHRRTGAQWTYNQTDEAPAALAAGLVDGEVAHMFNANPPWTQSAMALEPSLRVFVAIGRYDPTNTCDGEAAAIATLPPDLAHRITLKCYAAGHMMYRDPAGRRQVMADLDAFAAAAARAPGP